MVEEVSPTVSYYFNIFFNNAFDNGNLMFLETMVEYLLDIRRDVVFCFLAIFDNMNVYWFMIVRVEFEYVSKYDDNCFYLKLLTVVLCKETYFL